MPPGQDGRRLDRLLADLNPDLSRSRIKALIEEGQVSGPRGPIRAPDHKVRVGEIFRLAVPPVLPAAPRPQAIPLAIVFEDAHLLVVDKPAGLVVHPAAGNLDGTLVNALLAHCGDSLTGVGGVGRPGIVHRIDKDTSGLLVVAKTDKAHRSLAKQFAAHAIERRYTAICWGIPRARSGTIDAPLARSSVNRKKIAVRGVGGRAARTHYTREAAFRSGKSPLAAHLTCELETGRTHQIRVHLTHIGHPLIGDPLYGRSRATRKPRSDAEAKAFEMLDNFKRQALHAGLLGFHHPVTQKALVFESPVPADLAGLLAALSGLSTDCEGS